MAETLQLPVLNADFEEYLRSGQWSKQADDNIVGETIPSAFAKRLVTAYNSAPTSAEAINGLGLLALMTGVAEWGVTGPDLPDDPADKGWRSDTGEDSGKHLMSYAVGGVGISHADVGDLEKFLEWLATTSVVPDENKAALLHLTDLSYGKEGVVYDELRAAGRCSSSPALDDLLGETFKHFEGPAGPRYCSDYDNPALTENDWRVFRTWVRASLRTQAGQSHLLNLWLQKYWQSTVEQAPEGEGRTEEMIVNARVRNSAPAVARRAFRRPVSRSTAAARVQRQIDAYSSWKPRTARRRWRIMMRPVALYRHFTGLSPLTGLYCQ